MNEEQTDESTEQQQADDDAGQEEADASSDSTKKAGSSDETGAKKQETSRLDEAKKVLSDLREERKKTEVATKALEKKRKEIDGLLAEKELQGNALAGGQKKEETDKEYKERVMAGDIDGEA